MREPWYASREMVKSALDSLETARNNRQIDSAIESASRGIEDLCGNRKFYPWTGTRHKTWPQGQAQYPPFYRLSLGYRAGLYRLWLDADELITLTAISDAGNTVTLANVILEPINLGPPYTRIELDRSSTSSFAFDLAQNNIALTGTFGYSADEDTAGSTAEALDSSETGVDITDSSLIGIGDLIRVDSERMIVLDKRSITTGQALQTPLTASNANVAVVVTNGSLYAVEEVITLDTEKMRIVDILGNTLVVVRAVDGSVLATHSGSTIYAPRTLVVERGSVGTTAATHSTSAAIYRNRPPGLVQELCIAEAVVTLQQKSSGYATPTASSDRGNPDKAYRRPTSYGSGLPDLRDRTTAAHGRQSRSSAV